MAGLKSAILNAVMGVRSQRIAHRLESLSPEHVEVLDESGQHAGGPNAESHYKVVVVSTSFAGKPLVARHRAVHAVLSEEFARGLHALTISAFTPDEWTTRGGQTFASPLCASRKSETST